METAQTTNIPFVKEPLTTINTIKVYTLFSDIQWRLCLLITTFFFLVAGTSGCIITIIDSKAYINLIIPLSFGLILFLLLVYPYCFKIRIDNFARTFTFSLSSFLPFWLFQTKKTYSIDDIANFTLGLVEGTPYYFIRINFKSGNPSETIYCNDRKILNINVIMSGIVNQLNRILQDFK